MTRAAAMPIIIPVLLFFGANDDGEIWRSIIVASAAPGPLHFCSAAVGAAVEAMRSIIVASSLPARVGCGPGIVPVGPRLRSITVASSLPIFVPVGPVRGGGGEDIAGSDCVGWPVM